MEAFNWGIPYLAGLFWLAISLAMVWSLTWKGIALWKAGRNGHLVWFIVLFLINTLGILPITYIFTFSQRRNKMSTYENEEIINE